MEEIEKNKIGLYGILTHLEKNFYSFLPSLNYLLFLKAVFSSRYSGTTKTIIERIETAMSLLTRKEKTIIRERFGLKDGKPKTLQEVGKKMKITRERVRQIEAIALWKLRQPFVLKILIGENYATKAIEKKLNK